MLGAVLFELDGVLVDTRAARTKSLATAFAPEDIRWSNVGETDPSQSFEDVVHAIARSLASSPHGPALDDTALALVALRAEREYGAHLAAGVTLVDGAVKLVETLGTKYRLGVVTSWRRADAERVLALSGLESSVRFVTAADDGPAFASATARFAHAVARIQRGVLSPHPVVAIVAGAASAAVAQAAGARTMLVDANLPLGVLTPARLTAALDRPQSSLPPSQSPSFQR